MKSIRRQLVVWVTGALTLGIALVAAATYHAALQQIGTLFDGLEPGIPSEVSGRVDLAQRERAMRRFQRVDGHLSAGSGLGLPIAKAIAERHGGSLTLGEARPGRQPPGLRVQIRLSAAQLEHTALAA